LFLPKEPTPRNKLWAVYQIFHLSILLQVPHPTLSYPRRGGSRLRSNNT
jgi:hypothetical protein